MRDQATVVKVGGDVGGGALCAEIAERVRSGERVVLVHGGAPAITELARRLGVTLHTLTAPDGTTSRHNDRATVEVVTLALAGAVKPRLVLDLAAHGVRAAGMTGIDAGLLRARRKAPPRALVDGRTAVVRGDYSGRIVAVDTAALDALLDAGVTPVVSPPVAGSDGEILNVDADRVAAAVAGALDAARLVLLTDEPGLLRDPRDRGSLMRRCALPAGGPLGDHATGGMRRKLLACRLALESGVPRVVIASGHGERPLARALAGAGPIVTLAAVRTEVG